ANGSNLPSLKRIRRNEHCEIGLPASTGKGRRDKILLAHGRLDLENEHVLGEPALVSRHAGCDAQGKALLAEQGVSPVAASEGPDGSLLRELDDVFVLLVAGPGNILLPGVERRAY